MRARYRFTLPAIASALGLALACGGQTSGGGGGGGGGSSDGGSGACDDYFQTVFASNCEGVVPPSSELSRIQSRFDQLCASALSLPGVGITATALETCVSTIKSGGCTAFNQPNGVCAFDVGSLGGGSSCFTDDQCQSGYCPTASAGADGGPVVCGTCGAALAIGQPCTGSQTCGPNATCSFDSSSGGTCVALTYGNVGASCNETSGLCNAGLYCDTTKLECATPGGAGTPCNSDQACASPLVCPFVTTGTATCQSPGAAGASCDNDEQCAPGLGCDSGTQKCGAVSWVSAGQTCSSDVRCLVGSCPFDSSGQPGGTCPAVIPDGKPCSTNDQTTTCDTFASCIGGTCLLGYPSCP